MKTSMCLVLMACFTLLLAACGRKGPLVYPDMLNPAAPTAVSARQSGSAIRLQFSLPDKDRTGRPVQGLSGVRITKKVSDGDDKAVCRACMTNYALFKTIYLDLPPTVYQRYGSLVILLDGEVSPGNSYSYGITPFTADGTDGAQAVSSAARVVAAVGPPALTVEAHPTEIVLKADLEHKLSGRLVGINYYRWPENGVKSLQPLNREPHKDNEYVDRTPERGVRYSFTARMLVELEGGIVVESSESAAAAGMLKDDE